MVSASQSFHEAVAQGNPQRCLLDFGTTFFTNEDIDLDTGLRFDESINMDVNLTIGKAPASEISFTLFNDERRLETYKFGQMVASIGVNTSQGGYAPQGTCQAELGSAVIVGGSKSPYLTINGKLPNIYPPWAVACLIVDDKTIYALSSSLTIWAATYNNGTLTRITAPTLNTFMKNKLKYWVEENRGISRQSSSTNKAVFYVTEWTDGIRSVWEYVKLGTFNVKRPASVRGKEITITAQDLMSKLDVSFKNKVTGVTYPITAKNLLRKICTSLGITLNESSLSVMVNDLSLTKHKSSFDRLTCRDMVKYIAEQGGCYAKFNRAGELEMKWFTTVNVEYDENDYEDFSPSWYDDAEIDELHNRPNEGREDVAGSGSNAYLISGNPFL